MKKMLLIAAGLVLSALSACSTTQQATAQQDLAKLQTAVVNGCMVVQPTLMSVAALDPKVAAAATANGLFCTAASSVSATSVQSFLATGAPAIEQAVNASTFIPADEKPIIVAALGVFQMTLTNALAIYQQAQPTASVPAAASAPIAASQ